jgi:hypothetical protein
MKKIRYILIVAGMLLCLANSAAAEVSISIGLPNVSIGINLPLYPQLVRVPGYPVYYAPQVDGNYFFYDGMYWVYLDDNWYASSWYNGPWGIVQPYYVPPFILRIPVSYYRQPPPYFRGWQPNAPPRWGQHWGRDWEQQRSGWDRWNRGAAPTPAPLPVYQRQYSGDRYPHVEQQQQLRTQQYRYQPRETAVREHFQQLERKAPATASQGRPEAPPARNQSQVDQRLQQQQKQQNDQRQQQQQKQQNDQRQQQQQKQQNDQKLQQQQKQQNDQRLQQQQKQQNDQRQQQQQKQQNDQRQQQQQKQQNDQRQQQQQQQQKQQNDQRQQQQQKQQVDQRQQQQKQQPVPAQREPQSPKVKEQVQKPQERGESQEPNRGQGQGPNKDEERGRGRDK